MLHPPRNPSPRRTASRQRGPPKPTRRLVSSAVRRAPALRVGTVVHQRLFASAAVRGRSPKSRRLSLGQHRRPGKHRRSRSRASRAAPQPHKSRRHRIQWPGETAGLHAPSSGSPDTHPARVRDTLIATSPHALWRGRLQHLRSRDECSSLRANVQDEPRRESRQRHPRAEIDRNLIFLRPRLRRAARVSATAAGGWHSLALQGDGPWLSGAPVLSIRVGMSA